MGCFSSLPHGWWARGSPRIRSSAGRGPRAVRARDRAKPEGARLHGAPLRRPIDGDEPERRAIAEDPLEVVEQAPVEIPAYVHAVAQAGEHTAERLLDVGDTFGVVERRDPVLGDAEGNVPGEGPCAPDGRLQRLRPDLVAHLGAPHAGLGSPDAVGADAESGVRLHAEEVVAARGVEEYLLHRAPLRVALRLAAVHSLVVLHGEREPHRRAAGSR